MGREAARLPFRPSRYAHADANPAALRSPPALHPQAAELAANLVDWEAVEPRRSRLLRAQLERLAATKGLSAPVRFLSWQMEKRRHAMLLGWQQRQAAVPGWLHL